MRRVLISLFLITSILAAFPARAGEEDLPGSEKSQWGLRVGLGADPDQIVGGAQFLETPIAKNLFLVPNAEIGVGDDHLIFAAAAPFHYRFRTKAKVRPYAGGGVTVAFDHKTAGKNDDTDLEITLQATGGVIFRLKGGQEMFGELNLYFGDLWDLQAMVGWRF